MSAALELTAPRRKGWRMVGWQGITLSAPPDWNLVAYGGDRKTGNLRLDNGDPSEKGALGVEVRWSQIKGKITDAELEKRLNQFFANLSKTAKKQKQTTDAKSKPLADPRHPERDAARSFQWKSDRRAVGRIWHCTECGRLTIAQVIGAGSQSELVNISGEMLASLECHPRDPNWQTWSLYDLTTQIPTDYALKGQPQLMNIYVKLAFQRGQTLDSLTVEQWGVADVQLRGAYLDQWFRSKNGELEPTLSYDQTESEAQRHSALLLTGRRSGLSYWATHAVPELAKLQMPATHYAACIWECPESNKIYLVQSFSRRPQADALRDIVERTPCHTH